MNEWSRNSEPRGSERGAVPTWAVIGIVVAVVVALLLIFKPGKTPVLGYEVVKVYPHDSGAYTQGYVFADGLVFESTGKEGESTIRVSELESGKLVDVDVISSKLFGEGLALMNGRFYQLTWKAGKGFIYERKDGDFKRVGEFTYDGEGWGLTHDGKHLILSDGTEVLRFLDPETFKVVRTVTVKDGKQIVVRLNELEYIEGEVWANIWQTDRIARIDPESGAVNSYVDLSGLLESQGPRPPEAEVLNGIAWDAANKRLLVTGKYWPKTFHIKVTDER